MVIFVPALLGLLFGVRRWMELEHSGNLFWVFFSSYDRGPAGTRGYAIVVALLFVLSGIVNLPRMLRGWAEIAELSARRRTT